MLKTKKNPKDKQINSQYKSYLTYNESTCNGIKNISIYVHKARAKKRKKYKVYTYHQRTPSKSKQKLNGKSFSLAALSTHNLKLYVAHSGSLIKKSYQQNDPHYFIDLARKSSLSNFDFSKNPLIQAKWTVYRDQMSTKEEMWCCSCNSDSIFEVTNSLYDSYKKINCARKSLVDIDVAIPSDAEKIEKSKKALRDMLGRSGPEKKKILRDLAIANISYPKPRTLSVEDLLNKKVIRDLGLPPEPDNTADKAKLRKYEQHCLGVFPLEGKTPQQKYKILRCLSEKGNQLTEARMRSDKDHIRKRQLSIGRPPPPLPFKIESEKFRNVKINTEKKIKISKSLVPGCVPTKKRREAKPTGALTPLEGKSPEHKDKILRELAKRGINLPGKAPFETKIIDEVRGDISLPRKPQISSTEKRNAIAQNAGLIAPLERKAPAQTEKNPPSPKDEPPGITADLIRKDKPAGLLTPLEGKTSEQKDKVLGGSAKAIFPLQEDKSPPDKALVRIIKSECKIPEHTAIEQMRKARAASLITPLKSKTPAQKHKILRGLAVSGLRLPEETMKKAQTAGLVSPLIGKSLEQKQKALSARLTAGITAEGTTPSEKDMIKELAEAKTPSQRSLANKIRNELGLPLEPKTLKKKSENPMVQKFKPVTSSEKEIIQKAKANCFVTHIAGKTSNIKERIRRERLADADLPLPVGTTSENSLVKKVRDDAGIPLESTPFQKRGDTKAKAKNTGAGNAVEGIFTEFEDIVKTTTCDRGCGRDKKKIRFMNSYIKIRVTSPDLSSICVCPDKCFQGIKGGITTDKEEIKVTCLSAVGIPSYNKELANSRKPEKETKFLSKILPETDDRCISTDSTQSLLYNIENINKSTNSQIESYNSKIYPKGEKIGFNYETNFNYHVNESFKMYSTYNTQSDQKNIYSGETSTPAICEDLSEDSEGLDTSIRYFTGSTMPVSGVLTRDYSLSDTYSSISSIRIDSSLKLSTSSSLSDVFRASLMSSNNVSTESVPFVCRHLSSTICNMASYPETYTSDSNERINKVIYLKEKIKQLNTKKHQNECLIFSVTQSKVNYKDNKRRNVEPLVIINDLKNNIDLVKLADELLSSREFSDTSLFLVIPSSEEDNIESSPGLNSTFLQESETDYELRILVRILTSTRTIPTEQYHDELLKSSKEYSTSISSSTVNDNNKSQDPSSSTNCIKPSKNHKKIIIFKNKPTKKISNTKKGYIKWTTRSASKDRHTLNPLKKECLTVDNNKPCNVVQPLQVQTLLKCVKPRSHKRCQVSVAKMKSNRRGANKNDRKDGDSKLYNPTTENDISK